MFAPAIQRYVESPAREVAGASVAAVLESVLRLQPELRGYLFDDQGRLRHHLSVFVDGKAVHDRQRLSDPVAPSSEIYVVQALTGG
ncbi:MoaD/ThiS family protein [Crenobacter sp. SG2305]|uniref:MoaD/ThiS family protein n=1 Tax=Crenobacter oryzisoli TaxID=3056844 RepID=UPI0025AAD317|nr:MoaD/ThiS family protein [Crenobacter sp. SG2305]MDN0082865.1 MoaD/ThiS family protein [Crenobacter sp. SG2305]